ncbi:hypothetical protein GEMRC1_011130 [Eukaryota sp. GEM-RC1]
MTSDYLEWKQNVQYLYDFICSQTQEWPIYSLQWFSATEELDNGGTLVKFVGGNYTNSKEPTFLHFYNVHLPPPDNVDASEVQDTVHGEPPCDGWDTTMKFDITRNIRTSGAVNKVRICPHDEDIIATYTSSANVELYNLKFERVIYESKSHPSRPDVTLTGLQDEGYGLCWSQVDHKFVAAGCNAGNILVWDVAGNSSAAVPPLLSLQVSSSDRPAAIGDAQFHPRSDNVIAACDDNGVLALWDLRDSSLPRATLEAFDAELNCVSWCEYRDPLLVAGGKNGYVGLFDSRKMRVLHQMEYHDSEVVSLSFSPLDESVVLSGDDSGMVCMWDLSGARSEPRSTGYPADLLFVHGGHNGSVSDLSIHPSIRDLYMTTSSDNVVQIWTPAPPIQKRINPENKTLIQVEGKRVANLR